MAEIQEVIVAGIHDACDDFPEVLSVAISIGVHDACDDLPTGEEGPTPYGFIL